MRAAYTHASIDHEADRATDAYEAEFGATVIALPGNRPEEEPDVSDVQAQLISTSPL